MFCFGVLRIGLVWVASIGLFVVLFCLLLLGRFVLDCFRVCCYFAWWRLWVL